MYCLLFVVFCRQKGSPEYNLRQWQGRERRFKAGTFKNEKQQKWCSLGNSLSRGMLPRSCYSFLAKATGKMKSRVQQTEANCGGKQSFVEVSTLRGWDVRLESKTSQEASWHSRWHVGLRSLTASRSQCFPWGWNPGFTPPRVGRRILRLFRRTVRPWEKMQTEDGDARKLETRKRPQGTNVQGPENSTSGRGHTTA